MKPAAHAYASLLLAASMISTGVGCGDTVENDAGGGGGGGGDDGGSVADAGADGSSTDGGALPVDDSWTFFVYGAADNTLSHSLMRDMAEMAAAQLDGKVNVVVLADFDASQVISTGGGAAFPTGSTWYRIPGGGGEPEVVEQTAEQNLDDPAVLSGAIAKAFTLYPASHHAVVLWDHGGSWRLGFGGDTQDGTLEEPKPLEPATVAKAVKTGMDQAGLTKPLDLFSFDACLMAGAEVAWEFLDVADVYIGDAEIDYGDGWDYEAFLTLLASRTGDSAATLGAAEVATWDAHHAQASANDTILRSHIALDTKKLAVFGDAFTSFSDAWRAQGNFGASGAARALYFSLPPYINELAGLQGAPELRDVGQFLHQIAVTDQTSTGSKAKAALDALEAATLGRSQGSLRVQSGQYAMHVELPVASALTRATYDLYQQRAEHWLADTSWDQTLADYANANDELEPTVTSTATPIADGSGYTIAFASSDPDVAEVNAYLGLYLDDGKTMLQNLGLVAKGSVQPVTMDEAYTFTWLHDVTVIVDSAGELHGVAPVVWEDLGSNFTDGQANPPLLAVRGYFEPTPGDQYPAVLLYQDGDDSTETITLVDPPITFSFAELVSDYPGSTFTPVFERIDFIAQSTDYAADAPILIDRPVLEVAAADVGDGQYAVLTEITDVFGNAGSDVQDVIVPVQP